jgi:hypothetical protein
MVQIARKFCMIPGSGLAEAGLDECPGRDPCCGERGKRGSRVPRAGNPARLPEGKVESRLGKTIAVKGLLGVPQEGVIT